MSQTPPRYVAPSPTLCMVGGLFLILAFACLSLGAGNASADHKPDQRKQAKAQAKGKQAKVNSVKTIIADMAKKHEGHPHGVPKSYNWYAKPRVNLGNNPGKYRAFLTWGQLFADAEGSPDTNTRVELRGMKAYIYNLQDQKWHLLQKAKKIYGDDYVEDFANNKHKSADVRRNDDGTADVKLAKNYNFHFWPNSGRVPIDPHQIGALFTTIQARLVVDDPKKPDDRDKAHYLLSMGADYWLDLNAKWDHYKTNEDVAIGRFKYVKKHWRAFNMTTASPRLLHNHPPPLQ